FSLYLTLLLGIPQSLWRDRHLAHHAGARPRVRLRFWFVVEVVLVLALWLLLIALVPRFFLTAYLPGYVLGLALCLLHGHYEHSRAMISQRGRFYSGFF